MASSLSSPAYSLPGNFARLPTHSPAQPPPYVRPPLQRAPSLSLISGSSITAQRCFLPVVHSGWRDPSALSHPLLAEFLGEYGAHDGNGSSLLPSAAESVAVAYPALANAHVLWFKSGYYNFQVTVREDEPDEALFQRLRKEVIKSGVIRECRRRQFFEDKQAKKKRKAKDAARRYRRRPIAAAGPYSAPFPLPHQRSWSQGGARKSGKSSNRRHRARTPPLDLKEISRKDEDDDEEDNWELPEVEVPF